MEGPADNQAAMAMGHTEMAWDRAYDKHYQRREAQAGINAMDIWRQHMLATPVTADRPVSAANALAIVPSDNTQLLQEESD